MAASSVRGRFGAGSSATEKSGGGSGQRPGTAALMAQREAERNKRREAGFNLRLDVKAEKVAEKKKKAKYDPLFDANLRHYFESKEVQTFLLDNGLIDRHGQIIDVDRNRAKLFIIEQEFRNAEKRELIRLRELEEEKRRKEVLRKQEEEWAITKARIDRQREEDRRRREHKEARSIAYNNFVRSASSPGSSGKMRSSSSRYNGKVDDVDDAELDEALAVTLNSISRKTGQRPPRTLPTEWDEGAVAAGATDLPSQRHNGSYDSHGRSVGSDGGGGSGSESGGRVEGAPEEEDHYETVMTGFGGEDSDDDSERRKKEEEEEEDARRRRRGGDEVARASGKPLSTMEL